MQFEVSELLIDSVSKMGNMDKRGKRIQAPESAKPRFVPYPYTTQ